MKKAISLILAFVLCISLCACVNSGKKAFDISKEAFGKINDAYDRVNDFSKDIYEAWRLGINNKFDYDADSELDDFAAKLDIEQEHIEKAIAKLLFKTEYEYGDWKTLLRLYSSFFSACVDVVSTAYECNGEVDKITILLTDAKSMMKQLSSDYSDYEHYPALKSYFTNTLAFFDFCQNPEGSFEQVVETFNNYRNNAREYFFDLNYIFEDSIGGMKDFTLPEETEEE